MQRIQEKVLVEHPLYKALEYDAEKLRLILERIKRETGIEKPLDLILEKVPSPDKLTKKSVGKEIAKSIGKGLAIGVLPAIIAGGISEYLVGIGPSSPNVKIYLNAVVSLPAESQKAIANIDNKLFWNREYTAANRGAAYGALTIYHNMKIKGKSRIKTFLKRIAGWAWVIPIILIRGILEYLSGVAPSLSPDEAVSLFQMLYTLYIATEFVGAGCAAYNIAMGAKSIANDVKKWNKYVDKVRPIAEARKKLLDMIAEETIVLSKLVKRPTDLYSVAVYLREGKIEDAFRYIEKRAPKIIAKIPKEVVYHETV